MLDGYKKCEITAVVADLILRLVMAPWNMYVALNQYEAFKSGKSAYLEVHGLLSPSIFERFKSVTVMSANLEDTLMYHWFKRSGVQFSEHPWIMRNLKRSPQHQNGHRPQDQVPHAEGMEQEVPRSQDHQERQEHARQ